MFRTKCISIGMRAVMLAIVMMMFLPVNSFAQRRWVVERSRRSRIVAYQPRSYVVYQRRPYYSYRYETYSYPQPYYTDQYYSYRYSQPYFANDLGRMGFADRHQRDFIRRSIASERAGLYSAAHGFDAFT